MDQEPDRAADLAHAWDDPPGMGRLVLLGVAIGSAVSLIGVTAGLLAAGQALSTAVGLGVFVAMWGGLGFGAMLGGVAYATRVEAEGVHAPVARADPAPAAQAPAAERVLGATGDLNLA